MSCPRVPVCVSEVVTPMGAMQKKYLSCGAQMKGNLPKATLAAPGRLVPGGRLHSTATLQKLLYGILTPRTDGTGRMKCHRVVALPRSRPLVPEKQEIADHRAEAKG